MLSFRSILQKRHFRPHRINIASSALSRRAFHHAKADYVTQGSSSSTTKREINIIIGDAGDACFLLEKDVGSAFKSAIVEQTGASPSSDPEKIPLTFFHDTRHLAHEPLAHPRIVIPQDLPRQNSSNKSPATLWLWGVSNAVTLDDTPDHHFEESSRETHERLNGTLELLKDR